ncbi:helix-turn-helix transcriptional regulator [Paenibacillus filicis]|uniref:Helix-turn-helix transcriptional regulator n=1 Tax=Paenibacillus gyeongsangnamensis TaxID=3388067 RepID=A0ABT4Q275_9BACL|nr:AraC family transcriptional regulator [Paenibacillus filicis]MCZ8510980.1 helix-turn-helix transcriptional regulator [Paenibacillus filicis]
MKATNRNPSFFMRMRGWNKREHAYSGIRINEHPMEQQTRMLFLCRLLAQLIKHPQDAGMSSGQLSDHRLIKRMQELTNRGEMERWFQLHILQPVMDWMDQIRSQKSKSISQAILQYIESEYDTDLTLESIASQLHYHHKYLSKVSHLETGVTFSDYLTRYRIMSAKKLLLETDLLVGEIAERMQFGNSSNFIRAFKREEGMTPKQYRDQFT